jgi:rod shape determining protein RodA
MALPAVLVYLQPDLGTSLVFVALLVSMLLVWGIRWRDLAILAAGAVALVVVVLRALPALGVQVPRTISCALLVFLNPDHDTQKRVSAHAESYSRG